MKWEEKYFMQLDHLCNKCSHWGRMSPDESLGDCDIVGVCYLTVLVIETQSTFTCMQWRSREQYGAMPV